MVWGEGCTLKSPVELYPPFRTSAFPDAKHPYLGESLLFMGGLLLRWNGNGGQTENIWIT